ncbi:long-chain fatty acid transporter fat1 [Sporothrix curviconia]|uniref:Long-chain fatty acid transporter fat1 n=1 Tax=Sporothrix curviconia TaxID=1260050 RepID=A0ABP0CBI0_9PEZI
MAWRRRMGTMSIFYKLEENALSSTKANHPFLLFGDKSYTYAEVYDKALRYGNWWKETMGVKKNDVVAINYMNSDTFIFLWMGLWSIGAKPAFINYNLRDQALIHCVKAAKSKLMVVDPEVVEALTPSLREELADVRLEVFSDLVKAQADASTATRYPDEELFDDKAESPAMLIFTSGTTGLPKAAVVSWAKMISTGNFARGWISLKKDDIYYTRFSNKTFWPDVRKFKATAIQYVGETCRYLLAAPAQVDPATGENLDRAHSVRVALGNGLRPDVWKRFKDRFGIEAIAEFYGATEGTLGTFNLSKNDFTMGAVGRNGWLYELAIGRNVAHVIMDWSTEMPARDPATGFCQRSKRGEPGELIFRLPEENIGERFQGYYGNKKATESKIMRNVFRKGDAWFRTGDVMLRDSEGRTFFHDRIGDTFRWKSENVSTTEVAHVVGLHPEVLEANVYGIALPGHDGRAGCVAIVLKGPPTPELLRSLARHNEKGLPRYALPLFLRFVQDTSEHTTGTNKQQKHVLREQGADLDKVGSDKVFWLRNGEYVPFERRDWESLQKGQVKL